MSHADDVSFEALGQGLGVGMLLSLEDILSEALLFQKQFPVGLEVFPVQLGLVLDIHALERSRGLIVEGGANWPIDLPPVGVGLLAGSGDPQEEHAVQEELDALLEDGGGVLGKLLLHDLVVLAGDVTLAGLGDGGGSLLGMLILLLLDVGAEDGLNGGG